MFRNPRLTWANVNPVSKSGLPRAHRAGCQRRGYSRPSAQEPARETTVTIARPAANPAAHPARKRPSMVGCGSINAVLSKAEHRPGLIIEVKPRSTLGRPAPGRHRKRAPLVAHATTPSMAGLKRVRILGRSPSPHGPPPHSHPTIGAHAAGPAKQRGSRDFGGQHCGGGDWSRCAATR